MAWHNKNTYGYLRSSAEAADNAQMVYNILYSLGWRTAAICAMLGNVESESGYNPWRWQSEIVLPRNDSRIGILCGSNTAHAYGLCQSDPAANYIYRTVSQNAYGYGPNYSDSPGSPNDGSAQMVYLDWVCRQYTDGSCGGWNDHYLSSIPFATFAAQNDESVYSIDQLTKIFHDGYERSSTWSTSGSTRQAAARFWWNYFQGYTPPTPPTPSGFPYWLLWYMKQRGDYPYMLNRSEVKYHK